MHVDNTFQLPNILSVCPGFLGLERGLIRAIGKINVIAYVEIEAFIVANLIAGMEAGVVDAAPVWTDAKTFQAKPFHKKIHGILGGYPCQPFSLAGQRAGADDPRHLWPYLRGIIEPTEPVWCFFENVSGHLSLGFNTVYKDLRNLGYSVEAGIYTAEEVGAPHERERLFILAIRHDYLANTRFFRSNTGIEQLRWQAGANTAGQSHESGMADTHGQPGQPAAAGGLGVDRQVLPETGPKPFGEEMEHTNSAGQQKFRNNGGIPGQKNNNRISCPGAKISNPNSATTQGARPWSEQRGQPEFSNVYNEWPARPGQPQYEWEEPRTIEPGLGSTINGYNFREDLLRAYGNKVVEQTAEVAFLDLLQTHCNNVQKYYL